MPSLSILRALLAQSSVMLSSAQCMLDKEAGKLERSHRVRKQIPEAVHVIPADHFLRATDYDAFDRRGRGSY
jgi:hypothetical protein